MSNPADLLPRRVFASVRCHGSRPRSLPDRRHEAASALGMDPGTFAMADCRNGAGALSRALAERVEAVCRRYLPAGQRSGRYWTVGDVDNKPGRSLYVRLTGPTSGKAAAGRWCDAATGQRGDLLDLIALNQGHSRLRDAMDEARCFLALPPPDFEAGRRTRPHDRKPDTVEAARRLFRAGQPIRGTLAERYLMARGIVLDDEAAAVLRFHPAALYREAPGDPRRTFPGAARARHRPRRHPDRRAPHLPRPAAWASVRSAAARQGTVGDAATVAWPPRRARRLAAGWQRVDVACRRRDRDGAVAGDTLPGRRHRGGSLGRPPRHADPADRRRGPESRSTAARWIGHRRAHPAHHRA